MTWLSENWGWLAIAIGGFLLMTRMHGMGMGCGMAGGHNGSNAAHSHEQHSDGAITIDHDSRANLGQAGAIDPVSRNPIPAGTAAVSSVHNGLVYWFETRANRDTFEQEPDKYLADGTVSGQPGGAQHGPGHQHHGCC